LAPWEKFQSCFLNLMPSRGSKNPDESVFEENQTRSQRTTSGLPVVRPQSLFTAVCLPPLHYLCVFQADPGFSRNKHQRAIR